MGDGAAADIYTRAWHGDQPYDEKERIRLRKCCELFREHADAERLDAYRLLDIGCGIGPLREWLRTERFEITGLEMSREAAAIAQRSYDRCLIGDVEAPWSLADAAFDGVHAGAVLEHVVDWHAPLNNANRVLRPDGLLAVAVPNLRYWKELRRLIRGRQPHWLKEMGHLHAYTPGFLRSLLELHGFEVVSMEADRVNLPMLPDSRRLCRRFAGIGSVLIAAGRLRRRTRIEDVGKSHLFENYREVGLRSIEAPGEGEGG